MAQAREWRARKRGERMSTTDKEAIAPSTLSARAVHREQIWAALIRAVCVLLEDRQSELEEAIHQATLDGDDARTQRLTARCLALQAHIEELYALFPVLRERRRVQATNLSGGQLRMLALAKEIVVPPRLLLVDEPSVGMAPNVAAELYDFLVGLPAAGTTVLLVDQNIADAVRVARTVYLVGEGRILREGSGAWFAGHLDQVIQEMLRGPRPVGVSSAAEPIPRDAAPGAPDSGP